MHTVILVSEYLLTLAYNEPLERPVAVTDRELAATQFALFSALTAVPRTVIGAFTGVMVEHLGWTNFFLVCTVLAIPGMLLLFKVAPWNADD